MDSSWNTSYVFGYDNESGWGGRYFFTYFTQFGERSATVIALEIFVLISIFLVSVFANVAIAVCVFRFPDMRTVTNCFVLNLAAADLLFAATIPAVAYSRIYESWKLGDFSCRFIPYVQFVSGIVLLWTLALISIDRHRCIVVPPYRSKMTPNEACQLSGVTWVVITVLFIPVLFWFRAQTSEEGAAVCTLIFPKSEKLNFSLCFVLPVVFVACLLPMIILVYNYQRIFQKIISTRNTWASSCVVVGATDIKKCGGRGRRQSELSISDIFTPWPRKLSLSQQEEMRLHKHVRVVRVLFLNVVMVLLMWLPITIVSFLIFVDGQRTDGQNFFLRSYHFVLSLIVALLNTVVNPVLYGMLSDNFRTCLAKMLCKKGDREKAKIVLDNATPSSGRINQGSFKAPRKQSLNSVSEIPHDVI